MESEKITIVDDEGNSMGTATREEIHAKGLWHETFHCWIVTEEEDRFFVHLQLRSSVKKDFPNLLDISAAGHLLADETVRDGVREVEEELGIKVDYEELIPLGIIKDQIIQEDFIDNERCHTFLYRSKENLDETSEFQEEEVAGMVKVDFEEFYDLCVGEQREMAVDGFRILSDQTKTSITKKIRKNELVPHSQEYLEQVAQRISREL